MTLLKVIGKESMPSFQDEENVSFTADQL